MQEDNWNKKLAEYLRRQQEDRPLPYKPGAWEAFEKRRKNLGPYPVALNWPVGIAASVILILAVAKYLDRPRIENQVDKTLVANDLKTESGVPKVIEYDSVIMFKKQEMELPGSTQGEAAGGSGFRRLERVVVSNSKSPSKQELIHSTSSLENLLDGKEVNEVSTLLNSEKNTIVDKQPLVVGMVDSKVSASLMTEQEAIDVLFSQDEKEKVPGSEKPNSSSFFLGFGPGYGNSTQKSVESSGSNLAIGIIYDLEFKENFSLGSGLGFNFYNQTNLSQYFPQLANNSQVITLSSPVKQEQKVQQVQVDVPIYVRYALTRNHTVSLQAGFSNLITFNQDALQTVSYTIQVRGSDAMNGPTSLVPNFKTQLVNQTSVLDVAKNKFYPLAMANLGVNILVYRTQKTSFLVMPYFTYPLQDISGTGNNPGISGATLKVNFSTTRK